MVDEMARRRGRMRIDSMRVVLNISIIETDLALCVQKAVVSAHSLQCISHWLRVFPEEIFVVYGLFMFLLLCLY